LQATRTDLLQLRRRGVVRCLDGLLRNGRVRSRVIAQQFHLQDRSLTPRRLLLRRQCTAYLPLRLVASLAENGSGVIRIQRHLAGVALPKDARHAKEREAAAQIRGTRELWGKDTIS
jgi:hypothetical protein